MDDGFCAEVIEAARQAGISSVGVMTGRIEDNQDGIGATDVQLILKKPFEASELRTAIAQLLRASAEAQT